MKPITIVGGGLAGLTLGIGLRQRGIPVIVCEAGHYPRHRVCGEFISGRGRDALRELGLEQKILDAGAIEANNAAFLSTRGRMHHQLPQPALCISRFKLDALLAETFEKLGGELQINRRWAEAFTDGIVRATGRRVRIAPASKRWFGLKAHANNVSLGADLEMHIVPNGYVGMCKLASGEVNVCGLFRSDRAVADLAQHWQRWLRGSEDSTLHARLRDAKFDEETFCSAAGLDLRPQLASEHDECCIGDAVTMIAPATGNGMSMAFESAALAINPLAAYSTGKLSWAGMKQQVASQCDRRFARRLKWANRFQYFLMSRPQVLIALGKCSPVWRLCFEITR
jgi:flavin-dependent dehydrogenase